MDRDAERERERERNAPPNKYGVNWRPKELPRL